MVLGAGLGTRLKPLTDVLPKPLVPVLGVPCIEFSFLNLLMAGLKEAVVNIHAHPDLMEAYLKKNSFSTLSIAISDERSCLLGSAGGIRKALAFFEGSPFFTMNADTLSPIDLRALEQRHFELGEAHETWITLALAKGDALSNQQENYREIQVDEKSGRVTGFGEKIKQKPFFTGIAVMDPKAFMHLPIQAVSEFVPDVLEPLIQKNKVGFYWMDQMWLDIGSPLLWWGAHFQLWKALEEQRLPSAWKKRVEAGMKTLSIYKDHHFIDYQGTTEGFMPDKKNKKQIRLGNHIYEI